MRLFSKKVLIRLVILLFLIIAIYIFNLNNQVRAEFSKQLTSSQNFSQIQYSLDNYPKDRKAIIPKIL